MKEKFSFSSVFAQALIILFCFILIFARGEAFSKKIGEDKVSASLPELKILLSVIKDGEGKVSHVGVTLEIFEASNEDDKPLRLKAPLKYANVTGIAERIENLRAWDEEGALELKQLEDVSEEGGMIIWRKWEVSRKTRGKVRVSYLSRLPERELRQPGPPYYLSSEGGGVSGAGCGFMALPEESGDFKLSLSWDLEGLGPGSSASCSLGDGNFESICPIERIFQSWFIAGPLERFPEQGNINGFSSAWLGEAPFDARELMSWSSQAFTALKAFFRDESEDAYRFFMRIGPDYPGVGGTALYNSFMLYVATEPELVRDPRGTIFHEMTHKWVGEMEGQGGEAFWFTEGLTVHYTRVVMYRAGLCSAEEYLEDANGSVIRYFTSPRRNLPNARIGELFWEDQDAQRIPYDRGSLYFAHLDAEMRELTKGERSLDDLILSLFERRRKGEKLTLKLWLEELEKELGPSGVKEFNSIIIEGKEFVPHPDAFGKEFERVPAKLRQFELGFDERSLRGKERRITGLVKGTAAERAGLQNGDLILNKVNLNEIKKDDSLPLRLRIRRGDKVFEVEYLPRGKEIDGYRWVRRGTNIKGNI